MTPCGLTAINECAATDALMNATPLLSSLLNGHPCDERIVESSELRSLVIKFYEE